MKTWLVRIAIALAVTTFAVATGAAPTSIPAALAPAAAVAADPLPANFGAETDENDAGCAVASEHEPLAASGWGNRGICYAFCGFQGWVGVADQVTQQECCSGQYQCPDGSSPSSKYFQPYGGAAVLCGPSID
ncbi:MAG TPA: hypothetical protein VHQ65_14095 [Thermoanaerobaculia bacterium]|nr:hypothetical protein [Thermoanaerobaculia bacterium]